MRFGQKMVYALLALVVLAVVMSIGVGVFRPPRLTADLLMAVVWLLVGAMLPMSINAMALDRSASRWLCWSGIAAMMIALPFWIARIVLDAMISEQDGARMIAFAGVLSGWSLTAGLTGALLTAPLVHPWERTMRWLTLTALQLMYLTGCWMLIFYVRSWDRPSRELDAAMDQASRPVAALAILAGAGVMGMIVGYCYRKLLGDAPGGIERRPFHATCPRCGREQNLHTGGDQCTTCGLKVTVNVA